MKATHRSVFILVVLSMFVDYSCRKHDFQNPVDPDFTLTAPSNVRVVTASETQVTLAWDDQNYHEEFPNALPSYEVETSTDGIHFSRVALVSADVKSLVVNSVFSTDSTYSFRIRTVEDTKKSEYSTVLPVKIDFPAPSNVLVTMLTESSVSLRWQDNSAIESCFEIEQSSDGLNFSRIDTAAANTTNKTIAGSFLPGTVYRFRVRARSTNNASAYAMSAQASLLSPPVSVSVTQLNETSVTVGWTDNVNTGVTSYQIEQSTDGGAYSIVKDAVPAPGPTTIGGLKPLGSTYAFRVRAASASSIGAASAPRSIVLTINAPSNMSVTMICKDSVSLQWQDNSSFESGFDIEQSADGTTFTQIGSAAANATSATVTRAFAAYQTYAFRIRAHSSGTQSAYTAAVNAIVNNLIAVAGGSFTAKSTAVTVGSYKIDAYEVTYDLWTKVRTWAMAHGYADLPAGENGSTPVGANNPVTTVNWYDAVKWCNARSEMDGVTPAYYTDNSQTSVYRTGQLDINIGAVKWTAGGYRLPTEVEWEYAAGGGNRSHGYNFSGGNSLDAVAWYDANSGSATHSVGLKQANELGLYDMSGNVREWCWDWWYALSSYPYGDSVDPKGPASTQSYRMIRGGSFGASSGYCWVNFRESYQPGFAANAFGFRCVQR